MGVTRNGGAGDTAHQIAFFLRELTVDEPGRRAPAVKGLGRVGRRIAEYGGTVARVGEAIERAAQDPEAVVRAGAADGLGRLGPAGGDGAGAVVVGLMGDPDGGVRRRASLAAERLALEGLDVVEAFRRLMDDDSDWHLRLNGLLGLTRREGTPDTTVLIRLLGDTNTYVWGHARTALYPLLRQKSVLEQVLDTARQGQGLSRARALDMLPSQYLDQLRDSLIEGLRDECPGVRGMAASKLSGYRRSRTVDAVLSALARPMRRPPGRPSIPSASGAKSEPCPSPCAGWTIRGRDPPPYGYCPASIRRRPGSGSGWWSYPGPVPSRCPVAVIPMSVGPPPRRWASARTDGPPSCCCRSSTIPMSGYGVERCGV